MSRSGLLLATVAALVSVLAAVWLRGGEEPSPAPAPASQEAPARASVSGPPADSALEPAPETTGATLPRIPLEELAARRDLGSGESPEVLARQPTRIDYPLEEKFRDQVWSDVPHELIAAHDGSPEQEQEGPRRLFIALVEPGLPDALVERLVRDLRARHDDADFLRIRVFDSREAAARPSWTDGGAAREAHMLADLLREPSRERLVVRGVEVRL